MNIRRILMITAAVAVLMPLLAPTTSFAFGRGGGGGGGGWHGGGGGMHMGGGGGGWHGGGGGGWHGAGIAAGPRGMAGGVAVGGAGWRGGNVAMGNGGWHGGGWHDGRHFHRGFFPGVVAGAVIGGAIADSNAYYDGGPGYYGPQYGYDDQPDYYDNGGVAVVPGEVGVDPSYCAQRYRSYDPGSGTYLGFDGLRHPCP
jgi:hypothetical protein